MAFTDDTRRLRWSHRSYGAQRPSDVYVTNDDVGAHGSEFEAPRKSVMRPIERGCFAPINFAAPIDMQAEVDAIPEDATVKGMFFLDAIEQMRIVAPQAIDLFTIAQQHYTSFGDYSQRDYHRLIEYVASTVHPKLPLGEGVREIAWNTFPRFARSMVGRVVMGVLGSDTERLIEASAKAWALCSNRGSVEAVRMGERHWHYYVCDVAGILDAFLIGVPEGMFHHLELAPQITMHRPNGADREGCIRW